MGSSGGGSGGGASSGASGISAAGGSNLVGQVFSTAGGIVQAFGQAQEYQAESHEAWYNAKVAGENAAVANANANIASAGAEAQAGIVGLKSKAVQGGIKTSTAASGLSVNAQDSAPQVRQSAAEVGNLDAYTVRSNAIKEAYGYEVQSQNFKAQEKLGLYEASALSNEGNLAEEGTLIGTAGKEASSFSNFLAMGGLGG